MDFIIQASIMIEDRILAQQAQFGEKYSRSHSRIAFPLL